MIELHLLYIEIIFYSLIIFKKSIYIYNYFIDSYTTSSTIHGSSRRSARTYR